MRGLFAIGNAAVRLSLTATDEGRLLVTSLHHAGTATEWCDSASAGPAFVVDYGPEPDLGRFDVVGAEALTTGDTATLEVALADAAGLARITLVFQCWADSPVVRVWNEIENQAPLPLEVRRQQFLHLVVNPFCAPLELVWVSPFNWDHDLNGFRTHARTIEAGEERYLVGGPYGASDCAALNRGEPFPPEPAPAPHGERYRGPADATDYDGPFHESCGWLVLHRADAGRGLFAGWEWSGGVAASVREVSGATELSIGHLEPLFRHELAPGETLVSPRAFVGLFRGDLDEAGWLTRRLAESRYIPPRPKIDVRPDAEFPYLIADSWGLHERIDEDYVRRMIDGAAELGVEVFTLDKGWERTVGDWHANDRFPSGLGALAEYARERGIAFGLWCAFGNADPSAPVAREHPDWLATWDGKAHRWSFGAHALCLAHDPAREWVKSELDRIVHDYGVSWFLHDFETIARCNSDGHTHQPGSGDYANVVALYDVLDHLRAAHPRINVENCWNGGRMMDFGMLQHHDTSIGDDWCMAVLNRLAVFGATRFLPPSWCSKYMRDENLPPRYLLRSYLFGGPWVLMGDWPRWSDEMRAEAVAAVGLYKRLRGQIARSRVYHLREPDPLGRGWDAIQAYDEESGRGLILAHRSYMYMYERDPLSVHPRGLDPAGVFRVSFEDRADVFEGSGRELETEGIPLALNDHFTTELVYLERLPVDRAREHEL